MSGFISWDPPGEIPDGIPGWPEEFTTRPGLEFIQSPNQLDALWWEHRFGEPHELTPATMAAKLFDGLPGDRQEYAYQYIDHLDEAFLVNVKAEQGAIEIWGSGVALELRKQTLLWDKVESYQRGLGIGKKLGLNLLSCAKDFKLPVIEVQTENVGSHLWAEAGFFPNSTGWHLLRFELFKRLATVERYASTSSAKILRDIVSGTNLKPDPKDIKVIAELPDLVPARHTRSYRPDGMARLGQEMLVGLNWSGRLDISVKANERRLEQWLKS